MAGPIGVGFMSVISGLLTTTGAGAWEVVSWETSKARLALGDVGRPGLIRSAFRHSASIVPSATSGSELSMTFHLATSVTSCGSHWHDQSAAYALARRITAMSLGRQRSNGP
jgi:hypothetical protein